MFGEEFKELKELSKYEKSTIFFTPHDAALAIKLLVERTKFLKMLNE
jgi:hypothetical protein